MLRLDDGLVVLDVPPHTLTVSGGTAAERSVAPLVLLELGGCTRFLERRIETLAQQRRGLTLSNGTLGFALKGTHVAMALDAKTALPDGDQRLDPARARHEPDLVRAGDAADPAPFYRQQTRYRGGDALGDRSRRFIGTSKGIIPEELRRAFAARHRR